VLKTRRLPLWALNPTPHKTPTAVLVRACLCPAWRFFCVLALGLLIIPKAEIKIRITRRPLQPTHLLATCSYINGAL
jgi:hypothetical protein